MWFIVQLFGFRKPDGTRRFTTAVKAIARKNAKSTIAAAIGLYCLLCEGEVGPQVVSAATTGDQARKVFDPAKAMVERTADLREAFSVHAFARSIACYENGGSFKPLNAKASTQDGLNPSATLVDEVHAHKTHDLINVLKSASGARRNPLYLFTTTEGYMSAGPWPEMRHFMKQVLLGLVEADHFLAIYYAVDEEDRNAGIEADDDFDESAWIKANPLGECNPLLLAEIRKLAIEAKHMPGQLAELRTKRLNRPSSTASGHIDGPKWLACGGPIDLEWIKQFPCYGGLDLASTGDFNSWRLVWDIEGVLYTWGRRWVPDGAVQQRTVRGTVPYAGWVAAGLLLQTEGDVADHDVIADKVIEDCAQFNVLKVGYDTWNAAIVANKLKKAGVETVPFVQGTKSYHPAIKRIDLAYRSGKFRHGGDPVLTWCASNMVVRLDANLNMAPDKKRSADKIDDMAALYMATGTMPIELLEPTAEVW